MFQETAFVSNIDGEIASIVTKNQLACGICKLSTSCGNGIIEKYLSGKVFVSQIPNSLNAKVGDRVVIAIPTSSITKASLISYFSPIFCLFIFVLIGDKIQSNQIVTIFLAMLGLFAGFMITKYYNHISQNKEQYQIKMVRIVNSSES